jgi:hypothetical protein
VKPTPAQRKILMRLVAGDRLLYVEGESSLCLVSVYGDFHGRVFGGMRWRLTRDGWLKGRQITAAGRSALAAATTTAPAAENDAGAEVGA